MFIFKYILIPVVVEFSLLLQRESHCKGCQQHIPIGRLPLGAFIMTCCQSLVYFYLMHSKVTQLVDTVLFDSSWQGTYLLHVGGLRVFFTSIHLCYFQILEYVKFSNVVGKRPRIDKKFLFPFSRHQLFVNRSCNVLQFRIFLPTNLTRSSWMK